MGVVNGRLARVCDPPPICCAVLYEQVDVMPPAKKHLYDFGCTLVGRQFYLMVRVRQRM